ncbi:MAG: glycosyltransferase family 1 protein [Verrucomicrobiota bacterium]
MKKIKVGIDLAPASHRAPGTARHVAEQARALFRIDVPWDWIPLLESKSNLLFQEVQEMDYQTNAGRKLWTRATFSNGRVWKKKGCQLAFATAYFVPWLGIPTITNYFDSNNFEYGNTWIESGKRWNFYLLNTLSYYALFKSVKLFVNSQYCINVISKHFPLAAKKLVLAPPGITPPKEKPKTKPSWSRKLIKPFFLYVGIFSDNKNQYRLIKAWLALRSKRDDLPQLILLGPSDSSYTKKSILPLIEKTHYKNEIIMPGRVSDQELAWAYHNADAYIQPSIAEGFGLPIVEAMSYSLPVACSNTTSLPEAAGSAAFLFDPFHEDSIENALQEISANQNLRSELKELGKERPAQFTWKKNAEIVAEQIDQTLTGML